MGRPGATITLISGLCRWVVRHQEASCAETRKYVPDECFIIAHSSYRIVVVTQPLPGTNFTSCHEGHPCIEPAFPECPTPQRASPITSVNPRPLCRECGAPMSGEADDFTAHGAPVPLDRVDLACSPTASYVLVF